MMEEEEKILEATKDWEVPQSRTKEEVWSALEKQMEKSDKKMSASSGKRWLVAACIALVAVSGIVYMTLFQSTEIRTMVAQQQRVDLPDGSMVMLNADSRLSYNSSSYGSERRLVLEGEGFFDVQPGKAFVVEMNGVEVTVLGTSFNIYSRGDFTEVKCISGSVEVSGGQQRVVLEPGYAIESTSGTLNKEIKSFEVSNAISWQKGKFLFKNAPLYRVIKELEIQYGVVVHSSDLGDRYYTGYFENSDLEQAVKQIFSPMGLSYEIRENEIIIK